MGIDGDFIIRSKIEDSYADIYGEKYGGIIDLKGNLKQSKGSTYNTIFSKVIVRFTGDKNQIINLNNSLTPIDFLAIPVYHKL